MARKRMIDPDIWQDEKFAKLDFAGRLFFIGLITQANDYGKLRGNPKLLKSLIFPYEENHVKIEAYLQQLTELEMIIPYEANGENFLKLNNWSKYQTLMHPSKDNVPEPFQESIKKVSRGFQETFNHKLSKDKLSKDKVGADTVIETQTAEFFDYFLLKTKKALKLNEGRAAVIESRLKEGYTLEQLKKAVDNFILDDWADRHKYMDVIYCIGKRNKVDNLEKWLNFVLKSQKPLYEGAAGRLLGVKNETV